MSLRWPPRLLLALLSGLALAFAFPSYNLPILAWGAVAVLMLALLGARPWRAASYGFLHGLVYTIASLPWIYTVMRVHGGLSTIAAASVMALLAAAHAVFPAAFALMVAWLARTSAPRACLAAPFLWVALEFARMHLPAIGFPWNLLGYAAASSGLLQMVTVTGIFGLSFLVAAYNALVAWVVTVWGSQQAPHSRSRAVKLWLAVTAALVCIALVGPRLIPPQSGGAANQLAYLVQTNFPQSLSYPADWMDVHAEELDELERLSEPPTDSPPALVIWPEVPAPFSLQDPKFAGRAERIARASTNGFLLGVVDWKPGRQGELVPYNSAALLDPSGRRVFLYDKIHLVPFGEYVPLRPWLTFAKKLVVEVGDFQAGSEPKVGAVPGSGGRFGAFICYEGIFPHEVRRFVDNGAELLINLSNDGWFGRSAAPEQHAAMARVRAVENRRWLLRDTNNGYTVVVDPYGRYTARLQTDVRGVLRASFGFRSDRTIYSRWGDWIAWMCTVVSFLFVVTKLLPSKA